MRHQSLNPWLVEGLHASMRERDCVKHWCFQDRLSVLRSCTEQMPTWGQFHRLRMVRPRAEFTSLPGPWTARGLKVVLWLELLLHVGQLLDQTGEVDPPLWHLLPAPVHQLVHLSKTPLRLNVGKKCDTQQRTKLQRLRFAGTTSVQTAAALTLFLACIMRNKHV